MLPKPVDFYIKESETYYNSFTQYADMSTNYYKGTQLAFLKSPKIVMMFFCRYLTAYERLKTFGNPPGHLLTLPISE